MKIWQEPVTDEFQPLKERLSKYQLEGSKFSKLLEKCQAIVADWTH